MMKPNPLPACAGNDIWIVHLGAEALVVDPGDAAAVQAAPDAQGLGLAAILVTQRRADPARGVNRPRVRQPARSSAWLASVT